MTTTGPRTTTVTFGMVSELTVDDETVTLILEKDQDNGQTVYRGGMLSGQRLRAVALLQTLVPELETPDSLQNLAITALAVNIWPDTGTLAFDAAIANIWSVTLDSGPTLAIDQLSLSVLSIRPPGARNGAATPIESSNPEALSQQRKITFSGLSRLFGGELTVEVVHRFVSITPPGTSQKSAASQLRFSAVARNISITEVIKAFGFSQDQVKRFGLERLTVNLGFELERSRYSSASKQYTRSSYIFQGSVEWDTNITLTPEGETLKIDATVQIANISSNEPKGKSAALTGKIEGTVSASIPFFDTLELSVIYVFSKVSQQAGSSSQALATRTNELIFQLRISTLLLSAVYTSVPDPSAPNDPTKNRKLLRFSVGLVNGKNPTVGDLIAYVVSLYDPSIVDFELDPPWDEVGKREISLAKFSVEVDLTEKHLTISYQATLDVLLAKISNIGLSYQFGAGSAQPAKAGAAAGRSRNASNKKVAIALSLSIPGQPTQHVQWDPVNENPPDVPGTKAPIFDLQFLALGQRVAFAPEIIQNARTVKQFTDVMRQSLIPLPPIKRRENPLTAMLDTLPTAVSSDPTAPINFSGPPIRFSAESGWLIGAKFVILGAFDLSIVFNDPFIYGLRIGLSGPIVKVFDGFEFEILYRRISDTVGVYRTELTLPDAMRQLQFGVVSVTLPTVAIEIYTNGDFGLDVGFPWGGDFSRSVAVEALIFIGVGGFYFNKLSAETAKSVPVVSDGDFNPVLEFGIGLKLGLGRTFTKGPLNAEISITLHGLLQGVLAWFNPTDTRRDKEVYFRVQGGVAIVGRIYGEVDFKVIQVEVEVIARVGVLFVVEVYKAIQVALVAEVSVRASVKVLFIKVRFEFSLEVRQEFTLGSDSTPPWKLAPSSAGSMAATIPVFSAQPRRQTLVSLHSSRLRSPQQEHLSSRLHPVRSRSDANRFFTGANETALAKESRTLRWTHQNGKPLKLAAPQKIRPETLKNGKLRLDLYFQTAVTNSASGVKGIGLLFIENSIPLGNPAELDNDTDFDELVKALLKWTVFAYLSDEERSNLSTASLGAQTVSIPMLEAIYQLFVERLQTAPSDSFWNPLIGFLSTNFIFDVSDRPLDPAKGISGTVFPMLPQLTMVLKQNKDDASPTTVDFDARRYTSRQINTTQDYFKVSKHDQATDGKSLTSSDNGGDDLAIAELLLIDYFTLLIRSALQLSIDHLKDKRNKSRTPQASLSLEALLDELNNGDPFENLAGMTSRFLLHGLRLPTFTDDNPTITGFAPVYVATGQQFDITIQRPASAAVEVSPTLIQLSKPNDLSWIRLIDNPVETVDGDTLTPNLDYTFDDALISSILQLSETSENSLPSASPALLDLYRSTPQRYTIRKQIKWQENATTARSLYEFPLGLVDYLSAQGSASDNMPAIILFTQVSTGIGKPLEETEIASTTYQWATKLTIDIRQVVHAQTGEVVSAVYALDRIDPNSLKQLRRLVAAGEPAAPSRMMVMFANSDSESNGLIQNSNATTLLLKTNLSVESVSAPTAPAISPSQARTYAASVDSSTSDFFPFLALLTESSVVSGGSYYLSYRYTEGDETKGLPEALFTAGETAKIVLLLLFDATANPADYHNSVQMAAGINQADIVAESSEQTRLLQVPAGNLGFTLTRTEPIDDATVAIDELENLYQLLHYAIPEGLASFSSRKETLPIGPVETENDTEWLYEKVLPVYALTGAFSRAKETTTALPAILTDTLNPYYGIGDEFRLDFCWQDVYGNRFGDSTKGSLSKTLGYFDPIVGINQWPSIGESYRILPQANTTEQVDLHLELAFDQAKYIPSPTNAFTEALDHIKTDRATYQQIYYQVHDDNMRFTVKTSIVPAWSASFPRNALGEFVDSIYQYLVALEHLQPLEYTVWREDETLQSVATRYGVTVESLVAENASVQSLWQSGQILIPVEVRVEVENSSLWTIAQKLVEASAPEGNPPKSNDQKTIEKTYQIVQTHANTTGLLEIVDDEVAVVANLLDGYIMQPEETFESIAIAQLAIAEDKLIEATLQALAQSIDPAQVLANGVLTRGAANANFYVTVNASLEAIAYSTLQLEGTDFSESFDALLAQRIIAVGLRNQQLSTDNPKEPITPDTTIVFEVKGAVQTFKVIASTSSWQTISDTFPDSSETVDSVIRANAARQDWLKAKSIIGSHTVTKHDSLLHLALNQFVADDTRTNPGVKSNIAAEVGALNYVIEPADARAASLAALTCQLQLQTNRHRTVLETVRAVGNIGDLLTEETLTTQLNAVADRLSQVQVLFGTQDVILSDLLLDYTIQPGDSLEQIVTAAANRKAQTSAEAIALQNSDIKLQRDRQLHIPARFDLDTTLDTTHLAIHQRADDRSLQDVAAHTNRSVTAIAIANQTLIGRLKAGGEVENGAVLQSLLSLPAEDLNRLTDSTSSPPYILSADETLYTLTGQIVDGPLTDFSLRIESEATAVVQTIGTLNAIQEQLTFAKASFVTLRELLLSALNRLKELLLADGQLKPSLVAATVHEDVAPLTVSDDLNSVETAPNATLAQALQAALKTLNRLYDLSTLKLAMDVLQLRAKSPITVAEVGSAIAQMSGLITANQRWIVPPATATATLSLDIGSASSRAYPSELIFPVNVQLEMRRLEGLMYKGEEVVPEAEAITAYFSPKTIALTAEPRPTEPNATEPQPIEESTQVSNLLASLTPFATDFEQSLPGLKLAVGQSADARSDTEGSDTLYAIHMGETGILYNIQENTPLFFSAAPLSNTLMSATVSGYAYNAATGLDKTAGKSIRVNSVDLNALARNYLQTIEEILKPETAIAAVNDTTDVGGTNAKAIIDRILNVKKRLADVISQTVTHILEPEASTVTDSSYAHRQKMAAAILKQSLLRNLAEAYDIETIVQYVVDVEIATDRSWLLNRTNAAVSPRLSGQPAITSAHYSTDQRSPHAESTSEQKHQLLQTLDFSLSPAKVTLDAAVADTPSTLTFLFNTQTPQIYEDIVVDLTYQVNELEYSIDPQNLTSSWLSFVLPLAGDANHIGKVQIPIPLRAYPVPPSLIAHQALPDPDGFAGDILSAENIRDWNYEFIYEHPDVAQDTIECRIDYNSVSAEQPKLSINDVSISESAGTATFVVTLFPPTEATVTVDYATQDGTATSLPQSDNPADYEAKSGTLIFSTGDTTQTIDITILRDNILEDNEAFTVVLSNAQGATITAAIGTGTIIDAPILDSLVRFDQLYPELANAIAPAAATAGITADNREEIVTALGVIATLVDEVANAWASWKPVEQARISRTNIHYNIDEELSADTDKIVTISPTQTLPISDQQILVAELPGYELKPTDLIQENGSNRALADLSTPYDSIAYSFNQLEDATGIETFGESDIPDRKIIVIDLDVLQIQNAWGAIRLARNKNLVDGRTTNPAFIFQTPEVRFKNRITPLIINDKRWDIADLSQGKHKQPLAEHLKRLFETLLPPQSDRAYDLRVSCQYAFALAAGYPGIADDLLTALPILLTPRFTVQQSDAQINMLAITQQLRTNIITEITDWQARKRPNRTQGRYIFSVNLFSHAPFGSTATTNPNLPLLQLDHLQLALADITEMV